MRATYRVLAGLISIGVLVQAMAIAVAWFTALKDVDGGLVIDKNYDGNWGHSLHGIVGSMIIPLLAILLLIVSFFAKVDGGVKWALYVFGLVALQIAFAFAAFAAPVIGALHGANALALLAVAGMAARRAAGAPATAAAPSTEATA
ncbi:hypothetical protein ACFWUU_18570 [Kribbella sp. NPDC058693]|uniref:Uncharacterized protein n=1 Tax=Kribbella jiaozuonensis TaxID=2575441 RepID=A0A4U3LR03_9ACTN|nr:hypothetical protein [Kribbella jiaozuonensis]TKK78335.1 hypothetical protein FDA38_25005 [Kribbella jiaozuonensis]